MCVKVYIDMSDSCKFSTENNDSKTKWSEATKIHTIQWTYESIQWFSRWMIESIQNYIGKNLNRIIKPHMKIDSIKRTLIWIKQAKHKGRGVIWIDSYFMNKQEESPRTELIRFKRHMS